jgi:hypothetical protein
MVQRRMRAGDGYGVLASRSRRYVLIAVMKPGWKEKVAAVSGSTALADGRGFSGQFGSQTPLQFLAELGDFHPRHNDEFTAQHLARFVVIRQLADNPAILAFLVPAEAPIRHRLRAQVLEAAKNGVLLRNLKLLPEDLDFDELFVRAEDFRHDAGLPLRIRR